MKISIGSIVYWGIVRLALTIVLLMILYYYLDYGTWWLIGIVSLYIIVVHPIIIQYEMYREQNKLVLESSLCSSCRYFDVTAVLCTKLDEHPSEIYLPCEGMYWEPKSFENEYEKS